MTKRWGRVKWNAGLEISRGKVSVLAEVEPNEENVQWPTETTEEWEAAPGGVFVPVRPDTSTAGARRPVPTRAREYSRTRSALYEELDCIWLPLAATILRLPWRLCGQDRL